MAREQRKDVDYFPHDCTHGRKMHVIESKYGNDGYAVWFKLLEQLGKSNNHYIDISDEMTLMFLTSVFKVNEETTLNILNDLAKINAIDKELFDEHKILWSDKFSKSIEDAYRKRKQKMFLKEDILLLKKGQNFSISRGNPSIPRGLNEKTEENAKKHVNTAESIRKEEYSKVKESKEEKSKEKNTTPNGVVGLENQLPTPKIDFNKLLSFFNSNRGLLPEVKKLSDTRKKRILLLEKQYGKNSIQLVIEKTRDSPFLQGDNRENWSASFDWILKPANFLKILEDNYARKENTRSGNQSPTDAQHKQSAVDAVNSMFGVK